MKTVCASSGIRTRVSSHPWQDEVVEFPLLILLCRCADQRFALPAAPVTRVLGAAQFVAVQQMRSPAVGVVNVANVNLALCDSRLALGLPSAALLPEQRFIELDGVRESRRWLLWVEEVIGIFSVTQSQCDALPVSDGTPVRHALRLPLETVPLLDLVALEPDAVTGD
jgi:chemotaxis signal transduction protein